MNQPSKTFLTQFRDLCRLHGVDFFADLNGVSFYSPNDPCGIDAEVASLKDLEARLWEDHA